MSTRTEQHSASLKHLDLPFSDNRFPSLMPDVFSKTKRSKVMAAIRCKGNKDTELRLASILRSHGISGWRRHQPLPGKPDFVFRRQRVAVFVDGCFWHGCPKHGRQPGSNADYWLPKLARNKRRDKMAASLLRKAGWAVLRFWEHELGNPDWVTKKLRRQLEISRSPIRSPFAKKTPKK